MRGFTLVEILIVVVILGIIAAVVVPKFADAAGDAKKAAAAEAQRQAQQAVTLYLATDGGIPLAPGVMFEDGRLPNNPFSTQGMGRAHIAYSGDPAGLSMLVNSLGDGPAGGSPIGGPHGWVWDNTRGDLLIRTPPGVSIN